MGTGIVIDRIYQDFNFTEKFLQKLTTFYVDFMIPAIIGFTVEQQIQDNENATAQDDENATAQDAAHDELYCFCRNRV